jgi:hypothetical protein
MKPINLEIYTDNPIAKKIKEFVNDETLLKIHYGNQDIFWSLNFFRDYSSLTVMIDRQLADDMGIKGPMYRRFEGNKIVSYLK